VRRGHRRLRADRLRRADGAARRTGADRTDLRRLLPYCALLAPTILLGADVLGRILARPGEVQVGIVTAVIGGPFFLHVVRRGRWARA
jgi:ABC-type Fe3+-siderophore transport system permease subunit